jgi:hypothetical protein
MASPFTAYFAGIGTVAVALAVGFGGALMLTAPSPSQKEQKSAYEKRVEAAREKPAVAAHPEPANPDILVPVSPLIAAAKAPNVTTTFSSPIAPAPWPSTAVETAQESSKQEPPKLAPDPGVLQTPVRPTPPVEAVAPAPAQPVAKSRVIEPGGQNVSGEWKKKEKRDAFAQKKLQRKQIVVEQARPEPVGEQAEEVVETRTTTTYAPAPEPRAPLGIFNLLLGGN